LLRQAYNAFYSAFGLSNNRLIAWTAAATDRAAATMEEANFYAVFGENFYQSDFGAVKFPARSKVTAVFTTV
jgi:hypothetical protein